MSDTWFPPSNEPPPEHIPSHIHHLETKNKRLKHEIRFMQEKAERFNKMLFATGLVVNCTGCLEGGPANYKELTEEKVCEVERIAKRLRLWWDNNRDKISLL